MDRGELKELISRLRNEPAEGEILRIFDDAAHGAKFNIAVDLCVSALRDLGIRPTNQQQEASSLRCCLERLNKCRLLGQEPLYLSKAHLAVAFLKLGHVPVFHGKNYFRVCANCGQMCRLGERLYHDQPWFRRALYAVRAHYT